MSSKVFLSAVLIYFGSIIRLTRSQNPVTVTCASCSDAGSTLKGTFGNELKVKYTINTSDFTVLDITYNGTERIYVAPHTINTKGVTDKRLVIPKQLSEDGYKRYLIISLSPLTEKDNGATFHFKFTDKKLKYPQEGTNVLKVTAKSSDSKGGSGVDTHILIIGAILCAVILLMIILMLLIYKGVISLGWCYEKCCQRENSKKGMTYRIGNYGERIYETDDDEKRMSALLV